MLKHNPTPNRSSTGRFVKSEGEAMDLPAEPEVTRRGAMSNPVRGARASSNKENAMKQQPWKGAPRGRRSGMIGGLSLIGGAGIGAALMYLLDPEAGRRRRHHLADAASHAASSAGETLGHAWERAHDVVVPLAEHAAERAAEFGNAGAAAASSLKSRFVERAGEHARGMHEGARHHTTSARRTASHWFGHEEEKSHLPSAGATISAAACLAAGVGIMYLLDPTDGARRRAMLRDKTTHCLHETGDFFRRTGQHLRNRTRGIAHEARGMFQRDDATDDQIAERIRSRIGHLRQQSIVDILVTDGRATLSGQCTTDDLDALLSTVQSTPGVVAIVNQLDVRNERESAGLGGMTT